MSSDEENGSGNSKYFKLRSRANFHEWKKKTLALADAQGYKLFLTEEVVISTEEKKLEIKLLEIEEEDNALVQQRKKILMYNRRKNERKKCTACGVYAYD